MRTITTKLDLGDKAYCVSSDLDPRITELTVGQIRVIKTHPNDMALPCYREEYMCVETGVGSGTVWEYGRNIFATMTEAEHVASEQRRKIIGRLLNVMLKWPN